jgi:hypothetical protein
MQRSIIQVMQVRMSDIRPGDIINKNHSDPRGWFEVTELQELPNGDIFVIAATEKNSINGGSYDIVGVQLRKTVQIPDQVQAAA